MRRRYRIRFKKPNNKIGTYITSASSASEAGKKMRKNGRIIAIRKVS